MSSQTYYGSDTHFDFTSQTFRARKRWSLEVDRFQEEINDPNITIDKSRMKDGHVRITVANFQKSDHDLVINVEISQDYPMWPPFVWIESPVLASKYTNLSFAMFTGVPCIQELTISGWSPTLNLAKTFLFVYSAVNENCTISKYTSISREEALKGAKSFRSAHSSWCKTK